MRGVISRLMYACLFYFTYDIDLLQFALRLAWSSLLRSVVRCVTCAEGEFKESNGVKVRQGSGKYSDGIESYEGTWEGDAMAGKGEREGEFLPP